MKLYLFWECMHNVYIQQVPHMCTKSDVGAINSKKNVHVNISFASTVKEMFDLQKKKNQGKGVTGEERKNEKKIFSYVRVFTQEKEFF